MVHFLLTQAEKNKVKPWVISGKMRFLEGVLALITLAVLLFFAWGTYQLRSAGV